MKFPLVSLKVAVAVLSFALCACNSSAPIEPPPPYSREIARVDDSVIKEEVLRFRYKLERDKFPDDYLKDGNNGTVSEKTLLRKVLDKMIDDYAILAYGKKQGVVMPEEEVKKEYERRKAQRNQKVLETILAERKIPYGRWKDLTEDDIRVQYVMEKMLWKKLVVTQNEIRQAYQRDLKRYQVEPQARVRHIVTDTKEKADDILRRIKAGENFAKLAVEHSLSPERARGGELDYFAPGTFPKVFDDVAFKLEPGEVSEVAKSEYGYHIFKLIDKKPKRTMGLTEVAGQIQQELFEKKLKDAYQPWIEEVKKQVQIVVNESLLDEFVF